MNLALVIDTTSKYSDVWPMYFGQLKKHGGPINNLNKYFFTDYCLGIDVDYLIRVYYDNNQSYRNQLLGCLKQVKEEYIIYNSEDYILYNRVVTGEIFHTSLNILKNNNFDFVKLIKGPEKTEPLNPFDKFEMNYHIIDSNDSNFFAQQATVWKTESLIKVFENSPSYYGRMELEPNGSGVCRKLGIKGLQFWIGNENKRGKYHYDSFVWPCIATAIVKGKWNTMEYRDELEPLFDIYNIDKNIRGEYAGY